MASLLQLLKFATDQGASDLHISANSQPALRVNGRIVRIKGETLTKETTRKLCYSVLSDTQKAVFEEAKELDFSFDIKNMARFGTMILYAVADADKLPAEKMDSETTKQFMIDSNLKEPLIIAGEWKWDK